MMNADVYRYVDTGERVSWADAVGIALKSPVTAAALVARHPLALLPLAAVMFVVTAVSFGGMGLTFDEVTSAFGLNEWLVGFGFFLVLGIILLVYGVVCALANQTIARAMAGHAGPFKWLRPNRSTREILSAYFGISVRTFLIGLAFAIIARMAYFPISLFQSEGIAYVTAIFDEYEPMVTGSVAMVIVGSAGLLFVPRILFLGDRAFSGAWEMIEHSWKKALITVGLLTLVNEGVSAFLSDSDVILNAVVNGLVNTLYMLALMVAAMDYYRRLNGSVDAHA
jgi:hypothetical protein